ncbi:uncharacterized protein LOC125554184 [Triticum urartu]|nr:uncharacterized protein LOC125554184 [Triticum urartu]
MFGAPVLTKTSANRHIGRRTPHPSPAACLPANSFYGYIISRRRITEIPNRSTKSETMEEFNNMEMIEALLEDDSDDDLKLPEPEEQPQHLGLPLPQHLGQQGALPVPHPAAVAGGGGFLRPVAASNGFLPPSLGYYPSLPSPRAPPGADYFTSLSSPRGPPGTEYLASLPSPHATPGADCFASLPSPHVPPGADCFASLPSPHVPPGADQQQLLPPHPQQDQFVSHAGHYSPYYPRVPPGAAVYYGPRGGDAYYGPRGGDSYYGAPPASVGHHHHNVPIGSVVSAQMALVETSARRQQQEGHPHAAQTSRLPRHLDIGAASTSSRPRPSNFTSSIRRDLINRKDVGPLLTSTLSAEQVVCLLQSRDDKVQRIVLGHVRSRIGTMMADKEGSKVFLALVHNSRGDSQVLESIVQGVAGGPALRTKNNEEFDNWINSLRSVITAVADQPLLIKMLLNSLLNKKLMDSAREEELTKHLFNIVSTEILCEHGIECLTSNREYARHVSGFLIELYGRASGKFLRDIEDLLIENAMGLAVGAYSNYLLQHVLRKCSPEMKKRLVEKLSQDIVCLCADQQGVSVMQCYFKLPDASLDTETMSLVLDSLIGLNDDRLSAMVSGTHSSTVICEALKKRQCSHELNAKVCALALRINQLPEVALQENESSSAVLRFAARALRFVNPNIPNLHNN